MRELHYKNLEKANVDINADLELYYDIENSFAWFKYKEEEMVKEDIKKDDEKKVETKDKHPVTGKALNVMGIKKEPKFGVKK